MVDLSSDLSEGMPDVTLGPLDLKSELIFDEYERMVKERIVPSLLATYMAS